MENYKIDLHTHSNFSTDGGLREKDYKMLFDKKILDFAAITDHNTIEFAKKIALKFGEKIIVGEEIRAREGEVIGLYLRKNVVSGLSLNETISQIKAQNGIVYIPHPFETLRHGLDGNSLREIEEKIDIIEVFNSRARWRGKADKSESFAKKYNKARSSASDAHCIFGTGHAFAIISKSPTRDTLIELMNNASFKKGYAPLFSYLCPGINKIKNKFFRYE